MLLILPLSVASLTCEEASYTTCPHCFDAEGCEYCFTTHTCYPSGSFPSCNKSTKIRTKECITQPTPAAKDSLRYAIGFSFLAVALLVDSTVRFIAWWRTQDTGNH
jgi:hypothetical protein